MFSLKDYQRVSKRQPFISVALMGIDLKKYVATGDGLTKLVINRVGTEYETLTLMVLEQVSNKFTFAATTELLAMKEGRYKYKLYYKGNYLGSKQFILDKPEVEINSV